MESWKIILYFKGSILWMKRGGILEISEDRRFENEFINE
jgi:hypothetical protein